MLAARRRDRVRHQQGAHHPQKHDSGFYQGVVDYCLAAEGISLDDVDLVVRNCYVLPVDELEMRMVSQDVPEIMDDKERIQAEKNPLYLSGRTRW